MPRSPYVFYHYDGPDRSQDRKYDSRYDYNYDYRTPRHEEQQHHHHHHHYYMTGSREARAQLLSHAKDGHIHYLSPARSLPPLPYRPGTPPSPDVSYVQVLKARSETIGEPRVAVLERRRHWDRESMACLDCPPPRRYNKNIPSMKYERLRCPHCMAHVQPSQAEVQAYPWSVVSGSQPPTVVSQLSTVGAIKAGSRVHQPATVVSPAQAKPAANDAKQWPPWMDKVKQNPLQGQSNPPGTVTMVGQPPTNPGSDLSTKRLKLANATGVEQSMSEVKVHSSRKLPEISETAERKSVVAGLKGGRDPNGSGASNVTKPPEPMFITGAKAKNPRGTYVVKDPTVVSPKRSISDDDVHPSDSVSNVGGVPAVRAETYLSLPGGYRRGHAAPRRGGSEADVSYPRERYFESVRDHQPDLTSSTPGRIPSHRVYRGHYYDRKTDRNYSYNIQMGRRSVVGERRPYG